MNLLRWQTPRSASWPFNRLSNLRDEIDRLFEAPLSASFASHVFSGWAPPLDMYENDENIIVKMELPGMKKEDLEISLHDGSLSISGERKNESAHKDAEVFHTERFVGRVERSVTLPAPIATDKVKAQYKDGVLAITLPKTEEAKPRRIDVNVG